MQKKTLSIVGLGECMAEFTRDRNGAWHENAAGDVLNTLAYASRLGVRCGFITCYGNDIFGERLFRAWKREKLDLACAKPLLNRSNGIYFIHAARDGERRFQYFRSDSAATQTLTAIPKTRMVSYALRTDIFFFSAITLAVMDKSGDIAGLLKQLHGKTIVAFDTNYRAQLWRNAQEYRTAVGHILPYIDVVLPTDTDERILHPSLNDKQIVALYKKMHITAALKIGAQGALTANGRIAPEKRIVPVDTTGAGDAFNAGFLTAMLQGVSVEEAAANGNFVAGIAIRYSGALADRAAFMRMLKAKR